MATAKKSHIDYTVMTQAIANAALSRRAALQIELAVSLIHFTQENGGTDSTGKANLKAVYAGAGYLCMTKADRDYKTVNRRLNAMAKVFDKMGSSLVNGWIAGKGDTESTINYVVTELAAYGFDTLDDVMDYVGVETNRTRTPRQPVAPVEVVKGSAEGEEQAPAPAEPVNKVAVVLQAAKNSLSADEIRELCAALLVHVAETEAAQEKKAA